MKRNLIWVILKWLQTGALAIGAMLANQPAVAAEEGPTQAKPEAEEPAEAQPEAQVPVGEAQEPAAEAEESEPEAEQPAAEGEAAEEKEAAEPTEYRNWFDVSVGGVITDGDSAAFQRRYGIPSGAFGGPEDFHYEQDVGKKGLFSVDGRALFDHHDYSLKFDLSHPDMGYIRGGYREFRSYFDGSGGFFHPTGTWIAPFDDEMFLDRGNAFFEAGLTLPNRPIVTFRYDHIYREGEKDSTSWGDATIPGYGVRKIVPGFWGIDESRDIFAGDVRHTLGNTSFGLGLRYEFSENDNTRNILRNPGESNERYGTTREKVETDLFNVHAFSETQFTEKLLFTSGYSFTTLDTDVSGYRVYGSTWDPVFASRLPIPDTFENLSGGSELKQHVANLNLMIRLADSLTLVPSIRIEREDVDSESVYGSPAAPLSSFLYGAESERGLLDVTERLELRYTGLTNWVFYTRGEWLQGSGDLREEWQNVGSGSVVVDRDTDDDRFWQTYTVGANWYPMRRLNFGAQYYHKERWNDFEHDRDNTPNGLATVPTTVYPAFLTAQDFTTDDANFRVTWRPLNNLTLVGRYDFQLSTIDTEPDSASGLSKKEAAEMTSHIFGASASWTPLARLYLQGGLNFVWDETDTPADEATPAVTKFENDYWTANTSIGYALDDKTDLQLQYLYYRADNFENNSSVGLPYGADAREHGVTAAISRRINERMRVTLKYGYFDGEDRTSGERNDYQAHLVYSSLHYRF